MKRFICTALLVIAATALIADAASARWSPPQNLAWHREKWNTVYPTWSGNADTLWTTGAASKVDTTAAFNLLDCDVPSLNQYGVVVTANDSVAFAYITIYGDSAVTNTVNFKAMTCAVQVNWGTSKVDWTTIKTYTCAVTDGKKFWNIPLFEDGITADGEQSNIGLDGLQLNWQFAPSLRLVVSGVTSTSVPQMMVRLTKYRDPAGRSSGDTTNF